MAEPTRPAPASLLDQAKTYLEFSPDDVVALAALAPIMEPYLPALSERFYEVLIRQPGAVTVLVGGPSQVERLKHTLQDWARGLFQGRYDAAYAERRARIGSRHVVVGVPQEDVIEAMAVVGEFLHGVLRREVPDGTQRERAASALRRILAIDLTLMCDTYLADRLDAVRRLQGQLEERNRALEVANDTLVQAMAITAHELRTPLTAVCGFAQLLAENKVVEPARRRAFVGEIHRAARATLELAERLLDVARMESGQLDVVPVDVDLRRAVIEASGMLALEADRKGLAFDLYEPHADPVVLADEIRLRQVLVNVIGNAIKFTDEGRVSVSVAVRPETRRAVVEVKDTGIGIPRHKQALVFAKFQRIEAIDGRPRDGLGLGLALSRGLLERMGGTIDLSSEGPHRGTTATLTLRLIGDPVAVPDGALRTSLVEPLSSITADVAGASGQASCDAALSVLRSGAR